MRICLLSFLLLCIFFRTKAAEPELDKIRQLYDRSAESEAAALQLHRLLEAVDNEWAPVYVCYKGASEMMRAKYAFSPLSKYLSFKKGRKWIEAAVERAPQDPEIRYLRFTIQTNLPAFLGYNNAIKKDKAMLLSSWNQIEDEELKLSMFKYLFKSGYCVREEPKPLRND